MASRFDALCRNVLKGVEKILLDSVNGLRPGQNKGWCIALLVIQSALVIVTCLYWLVSLSRGTGFSPNSFGCEGSSDNLAKQAFPELGCTPPIDVVYTWVNGSDPVWQSKLDYYKELAKEKELAAAAASMTSSNESSSIGDSEETEPGSLKDLYQQIDDLEKDLKHFQNLHEEITAGQSPEINSSTDMASGERRRLYDYEYRDPYEDHDHGRERDMASHHKHQESVDDYLQANLAYDEILQQEYMKQTAKAKEGASDGAAQTGVPDDEEEAEGAGFTNVEWASTANRFRDNEELRFSLRSLDKYAPWVRHIYIVTDNQVPSWLDLSHPRLTVVPHTDIFPNRSHLPTFSSPAIESHLHRIPGLSKQFVYFNDDVMLGAPVWPSDFYDRALGQRIFLAWGLPQCHEGCVAAWIGDGFCDSACNVEACGFDEGDCAGENSRMPNHGDVEPDMFDSMSSSDFGQDRFNSYLLSREECVDGCRKEYLSDGFCDRECAHPECGWDGVDCFKTNGPPSRDMPFVMVDSIDLSLNHVEHLELPFGVRAASIDLSNIEDEPRLTIESAHTDSTGIVTKATFHQPTKTLNLVFANPGSTLLHHHVWGGTPLDVYTHGENVLEFFSEVSSDQYVTGGCLPKLGCERFDTLELAMQVCLARGDLCGGITSSNRHAPPVTYELRHGKTLSPSYTYEQSWMRTTDFEGSIAEIDGSEVVAPEPVEVTLVMSDGSVYRFDITSALPSQPAKPGNDKGDMKRAEPNKDTDTDSEKAATPEFRRVLSSDHGRAEFFSRRLSATTHENRTFEKSVFAKQAHLKELMLQRINAFRARVESLTSSVETDTNSTSTFSTSPQRRSLLDTFASSLLHVNRVYNEAFGKEERKVIAHMPHYLDIEQIEAMESRFAEEFEKTSQNRFRSTDDMQFAFAYMYWIVHQGDQPLYPPREYFNKELDTDGDGVLSPNELITLAAMAVGSDAGHTSTREMLLEMVRCVDPTILQSAEPPAHEEETYDGSSDFEPREENRDHLVRFTFEQIMNCEVTRESLLKKTPRRPTHRIVEEDEAPVAFQMIGDDFNDAAGQLDSIRARKSKFICVNDNMNNPPIEVLQELRNFQLNLFPHKSQFELPLDRRNRFLYLDEYESHVDYYRWYSRGVFLLLFCVLCIFIVPSGDSGESDANGEASGRAGDTEIEIDEELAQEIQSKEE